MTSRDTLIVNLREAAEAADSLKFHLDDAFFKSLDQEELCGGDVDVTLGVSERTEGRFVLTIAAEGTATVTCDRCLEDVSLPVELSEEVKVSEGDAEDLTGEVLMISRNNPNLDVAWIIFELIEVSLPLRRVHPEGECNADMLARFSMGQE